MSLFNKRQYLALLSDTPEKVSLESDSVSKILDYAESIFPALDLKPRKFRANDMVYVIKSGEYFLCHIKAFPKKMPDTFVILFVKKNLECVGYILVDLAAEYSQPFLDCPTFDFEGVPTEENIASFIPKLHPDDDNPFAILALGEGTYMQTMITEEGFILEHQLVNAACHYEVVESLSAQQVVDAMISYAWGKNEWLERLNWRHQKL